MSADHDELFQLILGRTTTKAVERILAAGYRRPRTITTKEDLVDADLGLHAVARDDDGDVFEFTDNGWRCWKYEESFGAFELSFPVTVLYEPQQ